MVDRERLRLVGPDCTCAEWLLRNGASVKFKGHPALLSDFNTLIAMEETPEKNLLKIEEIFAQDTSLSCIGFDHLKNCNHIKKITLIQCHHLDDRAMFKLKHVKETLQFLEMRSCFNIQDEGVLSLVQLRNLKTLILSNLASVKKKDECEAVLRKELMQCNIDFQN